MTTNAHTKIIVSAVPRVIQQARKKVNAGVNRVTESFLDEKQTYTM